VEGVQIPRGPAVLTNCGPRRSRFDLTRCRAQVKREGDDRLERRIRAFPAIDEEEEIEREQKALRAFADAEEKRRE
jgi:hypothetical protein